jgi:hypothetical protein
VGNVLLLALAVVLAGIVLATRRRRRFAAPRLLPGVRSAATSLRTVAASPGKLTLLTDGSTLISLAYIADLAASVQALHSHHPHLPPREEPEDAGRGCERAFPGFSAASPAGAAPGYRAHCRVRLVKRSRCPG